MFTLRTGARAQDNRGYSLVELLVTIAILTIMTGAVGVSIALAFSRNAEKCAKEIDTSLEKSRMYAMSQTGDNSFILDIANRQITVGGDAESYGNGQFAKEKKLQSGVIIDVVGYAGAGKVAVTFDKSTGRVRKIEIDDTDVTDAVTELRLDCHNDDHSKQAYVSLIRNTGKHYVEYQ